MVGLGETRDEVLQVMDDLRAADVDFLTIGQYLQPTPKHHPVDRFVTPDEFEEFTRHAPGKGFLLVVGIAADALVLSCRRRFPATARRRAGTASGEFSPKLRNMPTHAEQRVLPYTPEQMFDLVADVERYPEFLPWCVGARIRKREADEVVADLMIGFKMFRERFTSSVTLDRPGQRIDVAYADGPFRYLNNHWHFEPARRQALPDRFLSSISSSARRAAEADRRAVQRGRAPHGRGLREPRQQALWGRRRRLPDDPPLDQFERLGRLRQSAILVGARGRGGGNHAVQGVAALIGQEHRTQSCHRQPRSGPDSCRQSSIRPRCAR